MTKLTRKEKRKIMKIANIGIDIQNVTVILAVIGFGVTGFAKIFEWGIFEVSFISTCVLWALYSLSRIIFDGYIEVAEDIEEGYIK